MLGTTNWYIHTGLQFFHEVVHTNSPLICESQRTYKPIQVAKIEKRGRGEASKA